MTGPGCKRLRLGPARYRLDADELVPVVFGEVRELAFGTGIPHDGRAVAARHHRDGALEARVQDRELVLDRRRKGEDVVRRRRHGEVARLVVLGHRVRIDVMAAVESADRHAVARADEEVGMEARGEVEGRRARVLRHELEVQLHRDGHRHLDVEVVRPERLRVWRRGQADRHLRHVLGVLGAADRERHLAGEAVLGHAGNRLVAELRPADRDAAVERVAAVVVALGGTEDHGTVTGRTVGKDVRAQKRNLGRTELVADHDLGIAAVAGVEDDAPGSPEAAVQFIDSHHDVFLPVAVPVL